MAPVAVGKTQTALGAFYRRLAYRVGKAKAITATARKLAVLVYRHLKGEIGYNDIGAAAYEARQRERSVKALTRRACNLGFTLVDAATGEIVGRVPQKSGSPARTADRAPCHWRESPKAFRTLARLGPAVSHCASGTSPFSRPRPLPAPGRAFDAAQAFAWASEGGEALAVGQRCLGYFDLLNERAFSRLGWGSGRA